MPRAGGGGERGLQVPLFGSAIGSAFLSILDDREIARLARRARVPADEIATVLATIAQIRRDGYADSVTEDGGMWSIAAPLPQYAALPVILGLAGPAEPAQARRADLFRQMQASIARFAWKVV
jgi:DNA-binding IclR family transcriptional regulator